MLPGANRRFADALGNSSRAISPTFADRSYARVKSLIRFFVQTKEEMIMRKVTLLIALLTATTLVAFGQEETVKDIEHGAKKTGEKVKEGVETAAEKTKETAETVGKKTKQAAETVGEKTKETAETVGKKTKETVEGTGEERTETSRTTHRKSKSSSRRTKAETSKQQSTNREANKPTPSPSGR